MHLRWFIIWIVLNIVDKGNGFRIYFDVSPGHVVRKINLSIPNDTFTKQISIWIVHNWKLGNKAAKTCVNALKFPLFQFKWHANLRIFSQKRLRISRLLFWYNMIIDYRVMDESERDSAKCFLLRAKFFCNCALKGLL